MPRAVAPQGRGPARVHEDPGTITSCPLAIHDFLMVKMLHQVNVFTNVDGFTVKWAVFQVKWETLNPKP